MGSEMCIRDRAKAQLTLQCVFNARVRPKDIYKIRDRDFRKKVKGSPYSITDRRVPELIPVFGSQPAGDVSHKPDGRQPLLSVRPAVTHATLNKSATNFATWRTEAQWV